MPYVAMRRMVNTPVDSDITTEYAPGDPISDFMQWPENARFLLLREGYVQPSFESMWPTPTAPDADIAAMVENTHKRSRSAKGKSSGEA